MIFVIFFCFVAIALGLMLLMSYEIQHTCRQRLRSLLPQSKTKIINFLHVIHHLYQAASPTKLQSHWYVQQWWILIAGLILLTSVLTFAFTQPIHSTRIEAEYLKEVDPQIYTLLNGEILTLNKSINAFHQKDVSNMKKLAIDLIDEKHGKEEK